MIRGDGQHALIGVDGILIALELLLDPAQAIERVRNDSANAT